MIITRGKLSIYTVFYAIRLLTIFAAIAPVETPSAYVFQAIYRRPVPKRPFVFHLIAVHYGHCFLLHYVHLIQAPVFNPFYLRKKRLKPLIKIAETAFCQWFKFYKDRPRLFVNSFARSIVRSIYRKTKAYLFEWPYWIRSLSHSTSR